MRAIGIPRFGGPEVLTPIELPDPVPGEGEVLLRVHAATVNPTDTLRRSGGLSARLPADPLPWVPGMDVAGVVEAIGPGTATTLGVGDPAMAMVVPQGSYGGYAELVVVPAESVVRTPEGTSFEEASTLPMNGLTARMALDLLDLRPGQTLGVTGAAGCFGGYVVQLAKADGLRVVADAAPADEALVRALGADVVVPRGPDVADRFLEACPGGVPGLADGAVQHAQVLRAVAPGGGLASVRAWPGAEEDGGPVRLIPVWVREYRLEHAKLDQLRRQVEEGVLTLRVDRVHDATDAAEAHRRLEAGGTRGRQVLRF